MHRSHIARLTRTRSFAVLSSLSSVGALALSTGCESPSGQEAGREIAQEVAAQPSPSTKAPVSVPVKRGFVRLTNAIHPLARPELETGRLDPDREIHNLSLFFRLSPEQRKDRDALVTAQLTPASPLYHHWLTPEEYAARFGARPDDIARTIEWLTSQGLVVHRTSRLATRVTFSGKVAALEAAFQTEMHTYVVGGETHYAMATPPAFPTTLADAVLALHNTHDFYKRPVSHARNQARTGSGATKRSPAYFFPFDAGADAGPVDLLGPPDWATAYDVDKLYSPGIGGKTLDGTGVVIGIVGTAEIAQSDVSAFRTLFGLPATTVTMTLVPDTGPAAAGRRGDGLEAILDVEWSGGIAKGATINYVYVGSNDRNVDDASFYLIEENLAPVMSESYGGCEAGSLPTDADILEENGTAANLLGITYMAAAGDDGAADCGGSAGAEGLYVDMPGSFPGVTSVGGTQFPTPSWNDAGNLLAYPAVEAVWNESNNPYSDFGVGAGGGGISSVFERPAYQSTVATCMPLGGLPFGTSPSQMRQVPDVALSAASGTPGYYVECTVSGDDCGATGGSPEGIQIGGTSASSPSFTGVIAILNQALGERLGNINPMLYALNAVGASPSPFHDVTTGNNFIVCGTAAQGDGGGPTTGGWQTDAGCFTSGSSNAYPNGLYGFPATTGYDCATGLGSIDAYNLVSALVGVTKTTTALVASPTETTEGGKVTLTATVHSVAASTVDLSGAVVFTFESFTTTGATDLSWELGTATLTQASPSTAVATLETAIPPGLVKPGHQWVDVVAAYGGDTLHLPSQSAKVGVGFAPISFAVDPATVTLDLSASKTFTSTGGVPPVRWFLDFDTTRGRADGGAFGGAAITEDGGMLVVGPKAGYVEISALDSEGAEALGYITVGVPTTSAPWSPDAGPFLDADVAPVGDAGTTSHADAAVRDAGKDSAVADGSTDGSAPVDAGPPELSQGSCNCEAAGAHTRLTSATPMGAVGGFALGLLALARRRRK